MTETYVYVTSPTGIIHLAADELTPILHWSRRTLCGCVINVNHDWTYGDETLSGVTADCIPCHIVLNARRDT